MLVPKIGFKYRNLKVLSVSGDNSRAHCVCECGNHVSVAPYTLILGKRITCECQKILKKVPKKKTPKLTCEGCEFDVSYEELRQGITCKNPKQDCDGKEIGYAKKLHS